MRRRAIFAVLSAGALVLAGACSGGDTSTNLATDDPKAAMAAASKRTADSKTVRLALSATSASNVKVLSGTGSYDFTSERGRFKLQTTLGAGADLLITEDVVFVRVPQKQKPTDPSWIRLTTADLAAAGSSAQFIDSIRQQVDPRTTLDALGANVPDLKKIGEQKIRGTQTTHLQGRVDLSDKAIAAASEDKQAQMRASQQAFGAEGYPVDVWLDRAGRVRRVQYDLSSGDVAQKTSTTVRLDLYDFGKAPKIGLPEASDIGDRSSLTTTTTAGK